MSTCSRCNGKLEDAPIGPYCATCRWYFADDPDDADPRPALPMLEYVYTDDSFMTPIGKVSGTFRRDA